MWNFLGLGGERTPHGSIKNIVCTNTTCELDKYTIHVTKSPGSVSTTRFEMQFFCLSRTMSRARKKIPQ